MQSLKATVLSNVWNEQKQDLKLIIRGFPAIYNTSDFEVRTLDPYTKAHGLRGQGLI